MHAKFALRTRFKFLKKKTIYSINNWLQAECSTSARKSKRLQGKEFKADIDALKATICKELSRSF